MEYVYIALGVFQLGLAVGLGWAWYDLKQLKSEFRRGQLSVAAHEANGYAKCDYCAKIVAVYRHRGGTTACANCFPKQGV